MKTDDVNRLIDQRKAQALKALDEMVAENQRLGLYDDQAPKKEWVGLTPQEFNEIKDNSTTIGYAILQTEAKLKEKNT